jgi:hypothetical protein
MQTFSLLAVILSYWERASSSLRAMCMAIPCYYGGVTNSVIFSWSKRLTASSILSLWIIKDSGDLYITLRCWLPWLRSSVSPNSLGRLSLVSIWLTVLVLYFYIWCSTRRRCALTLSARREVALKAPYIYRAACAWIVLSVLRVLFVYVPLRPPGLD